MKTLFQKSQNGKDETRLDKCL